VPLRYLLLQGGYVDAPATAGVTDVAGVHTHWCVLGAPDAAALATARVMRVGLDAERMPWPMRGSAAWLGYTPTGVYRGSPAYLSLPLRGSGASGWVPRGCPCHCEGHRRGRGTHPQVCAREAR
jgi:hypothetical protein